MKIKELILRILKLINYYVTRNHKLSVIRQFEKRLLRKWLTITPGEKTLDLACGLGSWSQIIKSKGGDYYGIDIDYKNVMKTKMRFEVSGVANMDAEYPCFRANTFDKVFCNSSLQQFKNDDRVLKNIYFYLKPSGILVLTVDSLTLNGFSKKYQDIHRRRYRVYNYYDKRSITNKLHRANFELLEYKYYFNSFVSDLLFCHGILFGFNSWLQYFFPITYPIVLLSDSFFGRKESGCALAVKAVKKNGVDHRS